ncbi:hypothetical protein VNO77_27294 [Canavalia gladiata]|uniref:Uncharacterized protein n=1 Tax=Canavalia gladiata TaxID=3824 RepID=A0AAN9KVI6_CANGL
MLPLRGEEKIHLLTQREASPIRYSQPMHGCVQLPIHLLPYAGFERGGPHEREPKIVVEARRCAFLPCGALNLSHKVNVQMNAGCNDSMARPDSSSLRIEWHSFVEGPPWQMKKRSMQAGLPKKRYLNRQALSIWGCLRVAITTNKASSEYSLKASNDVECIILVYTHIDPNEATEI